MTAAAAAVDPSTLDKMRRTAASLVTRARAGDQNAIAVIMEVKRSVPRSRRAAVAYDLLLSYVKRHPVDAKLPAFGSEVGELRAVARCVGSGDHRKLVRAIDMLPRRTDRYVQAAHLVSMGPPVGAGAIEGVLPHLPGDSVTRARGAEMADPGWRVEVDPVRIRLTGDQPAMKVSEEQVIPSASMLAMAFRRASCEDAVLELAEPFEDDQRLPIRLGYVLGLARLIQGLGAGEPLWGEAKWELGA